MTTAAPKLTTISVTLTRDEVARVIGIPVARVRDWSAKKFRLIEPTSYDHDKTARYALQSLVLGSLFVIMQEVYGVGSPIPTTVLQHLKTRGVSDLADAVREDKAIEPISIGIVREGVETIVTITDDQICRRLRQRIVERVIEARS